MTRTKIEWTDETWNVATGCEKVSPGCDGCYAETLAERFRGTAGHYFESGFDLTLRPDRLALPLSWKKPRRVFVNSMSDLFHAGIPDEYIARAFAVMALTPQHTYQILTKRHSRMRSLLTGLCDCGQGCVPATHFRSAMAWAVSKANVDRIPGVPDDAEQRVYRETPWPLPNVGLGVSVENQKWADIRIPALAATPAAFRFLSCEPLLGPLDLTRWLPPISPVPPAEAPATWAEWTWPDWVPTAVRGGIEGFWGEDQGRSPRLWMAAMHENNAPAFGAEIEMGDDPHRRRVTGRFVYCWGNIGRLALANDPAREFAYTSFGRRRDQRRGRAIDWVIAGGESGHKARAVHPDWVRTVRDQTTAAGAAFFFKQWGEWAPAPFIVRVCDPDVGWKGTDEELATAKADSEARGATHAHTGGWFEEDDERHYWLHEIGHKPWSLERCALPPGTAAIRRWGKKAAGRELDGRTWDEMPAVQR
ncbi:phage Gp37/Gp68 family protein [Streptomyces sp. NPDC005302]|uniref:DUF5131 family protein n=1 Tax=Streptomyces sp. NPDC005302 TaxID=3154675 RepID=UPI0033BF27C2